MSITVAFDLQGQIRIMTAKRHAAPRVEYLRYTAQLFSDAFFEEVRPLFAAQFSAQQSGKPQPVFVQLPNEAVGFETFLLPNMSKSRLMSALDVELSNEFGAGVKERKINKFPITHNKQYTTMGAVYYDRATVGKLYKLLNEFRLIPVAATYCGNALLNGVFACAPRTRGASFVFADIRSDRTLIAVSSKGRTMGVATIPHGSERLRSDEVEDEYMATDHEAGELAVINARESARARALTVLADEEGEEIFREEEDDAARDAEGAEENAEAAVSEDISEPEEQGDGRRRVGKVKVFRKTPKRYPKFMQRELPTTPEGFMYENFRIIAKWILLYARQAALTEYIAAPEYVLVNLGEKYRFLIDRFNEEQAAEKGTKFRLFTGADRQSGNVRGELDLYGCLFTKQYNRYQNF